MLRPWLQPGTSSDSWLAQGPWLVQSMLATFFTASLSRSHFGPAIHCTQELVNNMREGASETLDSFTPLAWQNCPKLLAQSGVFTPVGCVI
jgi:hypothetical protein